MSASLVGSEMCIRDSRLRAEHARSAKWPSRLTFPGARGAARSVAPPVATVSYTHLTLPTICSV
eukprot:12720408-Alexandrium_andersonii.AAC.1